MSCRAWCGSRENGVPFGCWGSSGLLVRDEGVRGGDQAGRAAVYRHQLRWGSLNAWGGELSKLVLECVRRGLGGLESLTGIPGSIGGAVRMNAGGNFGDIGAAIHSVTLMDDKGEVFERSKPDLVFDYRRVNISARLILGARMELAEGDSEAILRTVKEIWIYKKNTQPLNTRNAGCVFKNPRGLSAGAMIDRAGLKVPGRREPKVSKSTPISSLPRRLHQQDVLNLIETVSAGFSRSSTSSWNWSLRSGNI
jgi:UDP-N-acetylmuramate dehydrogenase